MSVPSVLSQPPRVGNPDLNVPSAPPTLALQVVTAFTGVSSPVAMTSPPGDTRQLFICDRGGLVRLISDVTASTPTPTTFLDLPALLKSRKESLSTSSEQGLLGIAFHPNYKTNRYFYIFYSVKIGSTVYERVSRFTTKTRDPDSADSDSELILIQQEDEADNHNGGDLHFGPDGYLYISFGDEGWQNDHFDNGQTITKDFFACIARIDVDKKTSNLAPHLHPAIPLDVGVARFSVPADNPFVGATRFNGAAIDPAKVRTEFWAVGLRNPWRFSFDSATNELWVGDVGSNSYEEVDIITKGGNYGWAFREGNHDGPKAKDAPADFETRYHQKPLYEYTHSGSDSNFIGKSISGGLVYRGSRIPSLTGSYIFSDFVSGHIWSLVRNGTQPPTVTRIAGEVGIVAFGTDPSNGDLLMADFDGNRILRLTTDALSNSFPATLSATGLFTDLAKLTPSPGLIPYTINLPSWSDHAITRNWFTIPNATDKMTPSGDGSWTFPAGQIWVQHFDMETVRGNPATRKRLETRLLVKNTSGAYGVSYRWNDAGTDATLVPDSGADIVLKLTVDGVPTTQRWHVPSRSECMACHSPQAGYALSFDTRQLNRNFTFRSFSGNQLTFLKNADYLSGPPVSPSQVPRYFATDDNKAPLEDRVRSYLAVNCAYCHKAGGMVPYGVLDARPELTLEQTGLINGKAINNGGNPLNKLVVPQDPEHSVIYHRLATTNDFTRMPPFGSSEIDQKAVALLKEWIQQTPPKNP